MNLIRLIVIGLIIWLLYRIIHGLLNKPKPQGKVRQQKTPSDMVKCAHCGIHIPANEAVEKEGNYFCSPEHRDAGPR